MAGGKEMKTAVILLAILFAWLFYATVQGNNRAIEAGEVLEAGDA
jgi:hypothetical protein